MAEFTFGGFLYVNFMEFSLKKFGLKGVINAC